MKTIPFYFLFVLPIVVILHIINIENFFPVKIQNNPKYQVGLIFPIQSNSESIKGCCFFIPQNGFTIYDAPEGNKIGVLTVQEQMYEPFILTYFDSSKPNEIIEMSNVQSVGYEVFAFSYYEINKGFLRILNKDVSYWVSKNEIIESGFEPVDYQTFLIKNSENLLGYYANDSGLSLREGPNKDSKIIKDLHGDLLEIHPQNEIHNNWVKVDVVEYKEHPCETDLETKDNVINEYVGWVELVTRKGNINVRWYSGGC